MNMYVSNLAFSFQDENLKELFADYGVVSSAKVITDKFTNKSRGFGFVEMADDQAAQSALKEINGKVIDGRPIKVTEARPRDENRSNANSKRWD
jgi:RNA recognition motif-containing protein